MAVIVGELRVDPAAAQATWRGRPLALRPMELRLLAYLAAHPDRVHTRAQLRREVWGEAGAGSRRTVDVHVARLRRALGEAGAALVTVRRVGYRLDPDRLAALSGPPQA